jgi:hypothetical protein
MYALASGYSDGGRDMGIYWRPQKEQSVSSTPDTRSSSGKIVEKITNMVDAFEPEKTWAKASESFVGLPTSAGHTIDAFRESFIKREHFKLLEKVLALVPEDMKDNFAISAIIGELRTRSGATPHV